MAFARKRRIFHFRALFVSLLILCGVGLLLCYYSGRDIKQCFEMPTEQQEAALKAEQVAVPKMLDDVLIGTPQPTLGRSIFFHETTCSESHIDTIFNLIKPKPVRFNFVNLTARAACAVESAAMHNPNLNVFVLFASPVFWDNSTRNPIMNAIHSYPNIHLRNLDLWSYAAKTPIDEWFKTDKLFKSSFVLSHMSDFLRYLTLWRFGGTYLDMDVVVLQSLDELPPNYAGAESKTHLAAGVMNFGYDDIGRKVAKYCLNDFQRNFNGRDWGNNGPGVITRTLKHVCQTEKIADMFDKERCLGFQVYTRDSFYAVPWQQWSDFFEENRMESTLARLEKSIVAHVWNKHSKQRKVHVGDRSAYGELAAKHCPKVFAAIGQYF